MRIKDIRKKSEEDLTKNIGELRGTVRDLRFRIANKELKNHQQLRGVRKDIARILTVIKERGAKS
ncbi:MAG: 50S ribosomal protein L29 [Candidatus Doudnabacteria bacterium RIFCSPHIGHO2_01_FULL_49_9]|uniref:Large ribosomal subunit protein uL29 n=1 Tax=Candidatus Doudnabacteria bacterium RIFCSPHIGHO2_01_FULL_49_9 TaxID=1817827 RepID=A0A1F5NYC5_9BACT|nr:MAG: 50S ribosomal protein L29 [Candidatus Doudnabacteria bacterium RIFCSPHIGHO2_01_FULL_49_9]